MDELNPYEPPTGESERAITAERRKFARRIWLLGNYVFLVLLSVFAVMLLGIELFGW